MRKPKFKIEVYDSYYHMGGWLGIQIVRIKDDQHNILCAMEKRKGYSFSHYGCADEMFTDEEVLDHGKS